MTKTWLAEMIARGGGGHNVRIYYNISPHCDSTVSLQAGEHQSLHLPQWHVEARGRREKEDAVWGQVQTAQSQITGRPKSRSIHHPRRNPTATVTLLLTKGEDKRVGGFSGDCATSRRHALWSSVYTEKHVNDEGGDGGGGWGPNYAGGRGGWGERVRERTLRHLIFRLWWNHPQFILAPGYRN